MPAARLRAGMSMAVAFLLLLPDDVHGWLAQPVVLELCLWLMKIDLLFNVLLACAFHLFMVIFFLTPVAN